MTKNALDVIRWHVILNETGEAIPAFGIVKASGAKVEKGQTVITVTKPTGGAKGPFLVCSKLGAPDGGYGRATYEPTYVLFDDEDGAPSAGERWGAKPNSFKLAKECASGGFDIIGNPSEKTVFAKQWGLEKPLPFRLSACHGNSPDLYVSNQLEKDQVYEVAGKCYKANCLDASQIGQLGDLPIGTLVGNFIAHDDCSRCKSGWLLTSCADPSVTKITNTDLAEFENRVVSEKTTGDCWTVTKSDTTSGATSFDKEEDYSDCTECQEGCYTLVGCHDEEDTFKSTTNFAKRFNVEPSETIGKAVTIDGKGYKITAYSTSDCETATHHTVTADHASCSDVGCYLLTPCNPTEDEEIIAHAANIGAESVDLADYVGQTIRLDSGKGYTVGMAPECDGSVEVSVLEFYGSCDDLLVYNLSMCEDPSTTISSYTDYAGLGFTVGQCFKDESDECWKIEDQDADFEDSVDKLPLEDSEPFPDCDTCLAITRFKLELSCEEETQCDAPDGDDTVDPIVTTTDLTLAVGKKVRYKGMPFEVSTTEDDVTHESIEWEGPFDSCDQLVGSGGASATFSIVDETEDRIIKLTFKNGLFVGACPGAKASETC